MRKIATTIAAVTLAGLAGLTLTGTATADGTHQDGTCSRFVGKVTVYACAPTTAPDGGKLERLFEDSSAIYVGGWTFDGDTAQFHRA